jgi:hypothetical protein
MPSPNPSADAAVSFASACDQVEAALAGRGTILASCSVSGAFARSLHRLRDCMRSHAWPVGPRSVRLDRFITAYDQQARAFGFHLIHDWDGKADRVNENSIPVDVLNFVVDRRGAEDLDPTSLAILLDYYFLYVLTLLSMAVWNDDAAGANLDRLEGLLRELQGANGSGQRFLNTAAGLYLLVGSHFEPNDHGYDALLERMDAVEGAHRVNLAIGHASALGGHLRFGYEVTYAKSYRQMRDDNGVDYRWLLFSLVTLMRDYARIQGAGIHGAERDRVVEALLNGLTPDPTAIVTSERLPSLAAHAPEQDEFLQLFEVHRASLAAELERYRPRDRTFSALSFFFNFSQNVLKGTVADALLWGSPWTISLEDLLTGLPAGDPRGPAKEKLARILMSYARTHPDSIRGRPAPAIVYDPPTGRRTFDTMRRVFESAAAVR